MSNPNLPDDIADEDVDDYMNKPSTTGVHRCLNYDDPCEPESCDGYYTDCEEYRKRKKPSTTFKEDFEEKVKEKAEKMWWPSGGLKDEDQFVVSVRGLKIFARWAYDMGKEG